MTNDFSTFTTFKGESALNRAILVKIEVRVS